jgi:steroid 5-alpha reductase family enzyme
MPPFCVLPGSRWYGITPAEIHPDVSRSGGQEIAVVTVNWVINAHKILVTPIVLIMMWYFRNWSASAFLYLGLHGTYTLLWLIKQVIFADKRFAQQLPIWFGFLTPFLPLMAYMVGPYLLISEHTVPPNWVSAVAPFLCILGVFLHYVSDAQKFFVLQLRKGVIDDGLFARTRNPNYLGEVLIYGGFALASWHWEPFVVLAGWCVFFNHNMRKKDASMSRHPEFAAYKDRTGMFLPSLRIGSTPPTVL